MRGEGLGLRVAGALLAIHAFIAVVNLSPLIDFNMVSRLLDVNREATAVVWLSSATLLAIAAMALAGGWLSVRPERVGWLLVAGGFVLLSLDETAQLHEKAGSLASRVLDVDWLPGLYMWVVVVAPVALVAALWMLRWFGRTLGWSSFSGRAITVAVSCWLLVPVLEVLDPALGAPRLLIVAEETLEGVGQALFAGGLVSHLSERGLTVTADPLRVDG